MQASLSVPDYARLALIPGTPCWFANWFLNGSWMIPFRMIPSRFYAAIFAQENAQRGVGRGGAQGEPVFFFWLVGFLSSQKMSAYNSNRFRADGCLLFVRCSRALANFHFLPTIESHLGIIAWPSQVLTACIFPELLLFQNHLDISERPGNLTGATQQDLASESLYISLSLWMGMDAPTHSYLIILVYIHAAWHLHSMII